MLTFLLEVSQPVSWLNARGYGFKPWQWTLRVLNGIKFCGFLKTVFVVSFFNDVHS